VQPAIGEMPEHGLRRCTLDREVRLRPLWTGRHGPVHRLDDVAAQGEIAQRPLGIWLQRPDGRAVGVREAQPFQHLRPADQASPQVRVARLRRSGAQVGDAASLVCEAPQCAIETGPALGGHLCVERDVDLAGRARAELEIHQLFGAGTKAAADVVPRDDEVLVPIGSAAQQHMDMGIVGVPVIDGDPVQIGPEIAFGLAHEVAGEGPQVLHVAGVSGETMKRKWWRSSSQRVAKARSSTASVSRSNIPASRPSWVTPVALEIGHVSCERCRAIALAAMPHDARLHDDAPLGPRVATVPQRRSDRDRDRRSSPRRIARLRQNGCRYAPPSWWTRRTCPTKLFALRAPGPRSRIRPGLMRRLFSRSLTSAIRRKGSWHGERLGMTEACHGERHCGDRGGTVILYPQQPHGAPQCRAFYLAILPLLHSPPLAPVPSLRPGHPKCAMLRTRSSFRFLRSGSYEKCVRCCGRSRSPRDRTADCEVISHRCVDSARVDLVAIRFASKERCVSPVGVALRCFGWHPLRVRSVDQRQQRRDIETGFAWQRATCREMVGVALRPGIVGCEEPQ